jgi:hypothetical protein
MELPKKLLFSMAHFLDYLQKQLLGLPFIWHIFSCCIVMFHVCTGDSRAWMFILSNYLRDYLREIIK